MAQIDVKTIERIHKTRNTVQDKVYTTYTTFDSYGKHYVQIDTYGRSDREIPGKISQTIQLDETSAKYLFDLLKKEYNFDWDCIEIWEASDKYHDDYAVSLNTEERLIYAFSGIDSLWTDRLLCQYDKISQLFLSYLKGKNFEFLNDEYDEYIFKNGEYDDAIFKLSRELFYVLFQNRDFA